MQTDEIVSWCDCLTHFNFDCNLLESTFQLGSLHQDNKNYTDLFPYPMKLAWSEVHLWLHLASQISHILVISKFFCSKVSHHEALTWHNTRPRSTRYKCARPVLSKAQDAAGMTAFYGFYGPMPDRMLLTFGKLNKRSRHVWARSFWEGKKELHSRLNNF